MHCWRPVFPSSQTPFLSAGHENNDTDGHLVSRLSHGAKEKNLGFFIFYQLPRHVPDSLMKVSTFWKLALRPLS